jgi:hypothetical protein
MALLRLSLNPIPPVPLGGNVSRRSVTVDHFRRQAPAATETEYEIGWEGVEFSDEIRLRIENQFNDNQITEMGAVAVMGLLAHELEGLQLKNVVQVGCGGDYAAKVLLGGELIQIEVSGIRHGHPSLSRARLEEKSKQISRYQSHGFVSVTTFHQEKSGAGVVHSFLHHVESNGP